MRLIRILGVALALVLGLDSLQAATYKLTNGQEVTGEMLPTSANETGVQVKVGDGQYERVLWGNFSQEDLRTFAQNPKLQPLVEPFIEITQEERLKQTEVPIKEPPRLSPQRHPPGSVLGAMFTSGVGMFVLFVLYAATIYAGYEVAIFRARPPALVAGLSAIPFVGILVPIIFLSLPTKMGAAGDEAAAAQELPVDTTQETVNPMLAEGAEHPTALHIAHEEKKTSTKLPEPTVYQRGHTTFNRRFFETKFVNFFSVVRREADKDMVLVIKSSRGTYTGQRISRISAGELHLEVHHSGANHEVTIPFVEVQEVRLQHKDTPH